MRYYKQHTVIFPSDRVFFIYIKYILVMSMYEMMSWEERVKDTHFFIHILFIDTTHADGP